jgi:hypothetical protein
VAEGVVAILTNALGHSHFLEANSSSTSQEISRIL